MPPDESCLRPLIFVDPRSVANAIEAGWMLTGYAVGVASGAIAVLLASIPFRWSTRGT